MEGLKLILMVMGFFSVTATLQYWLFNDIVPKDKSDG